MTLSVKRGDEMEEEREKILEEYSYLDKAELEDYAWEFVRRNEGYRKAYDAYKENEHNWEGMSINLRADKQKREERQKYLKEINRFGLRYPLNYRKKANEVKWDDKLLNKFQSLKDHPKIKEYSHSKKPEFLFWFDKFNEINNKELCTNIFDIRRDEFKFAIAIDVRYPNNPDTLSEIKEIITRAKKERQEKILEDLRDTWKFNLIAYDLRTGNNLRNKKYKIKEISEIIYNSDCTQTGHASASGECSHCGRTKKAIRRAKELINTPFYRFFS